MSKRAAIASVSGLIGAGFGFNILKVPESMRGHVPAYMDIPSMLSNIMPGFAVGIACAALAERGSRQSKIATAVVGMALSGSIQIVAESTLGRTQLPYELTMVVGNGQNGEMRDWIAGVVATAVGLLPLITNRETGL